MTSDDDDAHHHPLDNVQVLTVRQGIVATLPLQQHIHLCVLHATLKPLTQLLFPRPSPEADSKKAVSSICPHTYMMTSRADWGLNHLLSKAGTRIDSGACVKAMPAFCF